MNSYRENLQEVVGTSLDALYVQQQKLESQKRGAQYSLYYAQAAQLTAIDNLETTSEQLEAVRLITQQGVKNNNLMTNVVASTNLIQTNAATTVSNSATTATNIQTAATAVSKLAADVGSALNIATASCYGTDIYKKTLEANSFIQETANQAEYASQKAMEASSSSSEVIATELVSTATRSKAELEKLLATTKAQFKTSSSERVVNQEAVSTASQSEKKTEGTLLNAQSAAQAIEDSVSASNRDLNFDLTAVTSGDDQIVVRFLPFKQAFSQLSPQCAVQLGQEEARLPQATPTYYVFVVSADKQSSIKLDQVESIFTAYPDQRFTKVTEIDAKGNCQVTLKQNDQLQDFYGEALKLGKPYLVYMYAVLDLGFQKYIGSYSNLLSSASQPVTLQTQLSTAEQIQFKDDDAKDIQFSVTMNPSDEMEYRVMLLPAHQPLTGGLMTDSSSTSSTSTLNFYFNQSIAMQVASANYQLAQNVSTALENSQIVHHMCAPLPDDMTDNFGNPLIQGMSYLPVVLITPAPGANQGCYIASLSSLDIDPVIVIPAENYLSNESSLLATTRTDPDVTAPDVTADSHEDTAEKKPSRSAKKSGSDADSDSDSDNNNDNEA